MIEYPMPSPNIVVVEDNEDDCSLLKKGIERAELDWTLEILSDGEKFLRWIEQNTSTTVDMFLIDLKVPRITGDILISKIKKMPGQINTPIIVLSGSSSLSDMNKAARAGCHGYFAKPNTISEYSSLLKTLDTYHFHTSMMYPRSKR